LRVVISPGVRGCSWPEDAASAVYGRAGRDTPPVRCARWRGKAACLAVVCHVVCPAAGDEGGQHRMAVALEEVTAALHQTEGRLRVIPKDARGRVTRCCRATSRDSRALLSR